MAPDYLGKNLAKRSAGNVYLQHVLQINISTPCCRTKTAQELSLCGEGALSEFVFFPCLPGPDSFYVTNDNFFHYDNTFLRFLSTFFLFHWLHGNIVFFDGFKGIEAFGGGHPNGISMDKDER